MLLKVSIPVEPGNRGVKEGILPRTVLGFVEQAKPESCYFTAEGGNRTAYFVFDLHDTTTIPSIAEPFFTNLNAGIEFSPVMNLEEMKVGVERAMRESERR
jgi:hypothetical protein